MEESKPIVGQEGNETVSPQTGAWNSMQTDETERHPKVIFDIDKPVDIMFQEDEPMELPSKDKPGEVYYLFKVTENSEPKVIMTSAWTLLRGLKTFSPLSRKTLRITRKMIAGKQQYTVENTEAGNKAEVSDNKPGEDFAGAPVAETPTPAQ